MIILFLLLLFLIATVGVWVVGALFVRDGVVMAVLKVGLITDPVVVD